MTTPNLADVVTTCSNGVDRVAALPEPYRTAGLKVLAELCGVRNVAAEEWLELVELVADEAEAAYVAGLVASSENRPGKFTNRRKVHTP